MVESVLLYNSELWTMRTHNKRRLMAVEMDYLKRNLRVSRLGRIRNEEIRRTVGATETIIDRTGREVLSGLDIYYAWNTKKIVE